MRKKVRFANSLRNLAKLNFISYWNFQISHLNETRKILDSWILIYELNWGKIKINDSKDIKDIFQVGCGKLSLPISLRYTCQRLWKMKFLGLPNSIKVYVSKTWGKWDSSTWKLSVFPSPTWNNPICNPRIKTLFPPSPPPPLPHLIPRTKKLNLTSPS